MIEKETVTGENARRVIEGKKPIEATLSDEEVAAQKEINEAYMLLSLIDSYSIKKAELVTRNPEEEIMMNFELVREQFVEQLNEYISEGKGDTVEGLTTKFRIDQMHNMTVRERKQVIDQYAELLYQHSLQTINVEETLKQIKQEIQDEESEASRE